MKNKLLALTLALLMLVTAIPASAIGMVGVETADEVGTIEQTAQAEVMANKAGIYRPGINFFTNTVYAETFEGYSVTEYSAQSFDDSVDTPFYASSEIAIKEDPTGKGHGKVLDLRADAGAWTTLYADASDENFNRPAYIYFVGSREQGGAYGLYIGSNKDTDTNVADYNFLEYIWGTADNPWNSIEISYPNKLFGLNNSRVGIKNIVSFANSIGSDANADGKAHMYYDDLVLVPYYKVTYQNIGPDGAPLADNTVSYFLGTAAQLSVGTDGAINGLPTEYTVDSTMTLTAPEGYEFGGWATLQNSTQAVTSVTLSNEDLNFYPVWTVKQTPITYTFKTADEKYFDYQMEVVAEEFAFPTAANLGTGYEPMFYDGTSYFYPGEDYTGTATEFTVYPTGIIFKEDFEDAVVVAPTDADMQVTPDYVRNTNGYVHLAKNMGAVVEKDGNKMFSMQAGAWKGTFLLNGLGITTPGLYKIECDLTRSYDAYNELHVMVNGYNDNLKVSTLALNDSNTHHMTFYVNLVLDNSGNLMLKTASATNAVTSFNGLTLQWRGSGAGEVYVDNVTMDYTPYAPTYVKMVSYRDQNPTGIRFASHVSNKAREVGAEYGYVVALESALDGDNTKLFIDNVDSVSTNQTTSGTNSAGVKFVAAAAFNKDLGVDKVYSRNGDPFDNGVITYRGIEEVFYTGVLFGITDDYKDVVFVARPFIKIDGVYYYGECYSTSFNEVYNKANS